MPSTSKLIVDDIPSVSSIARKIIGATSYYTNEAREAECDKFNEENLQSILKNENAIVHVAKDGDDVIGFIYGYFDCGTFWADWVGVLAEYRRKGVAFSLMRKLEMILRETKTHKVWCDTRSDNKESNALLQKLGFERVAHLKNHWYKQDYYLWEKFL